MFRDFQEKAAFYVENQKTLIAQKKSAVKFGDGIVTSMPKASIVKNLEDTGKLQVKSIINTTNWFDSHEDVHIRGLWNRSLKNSKWLMHVQEHQSTKFDKIIADGEDLKAMVEDYTWQELGYDAKGITQALAFDSLVKKERNEYMYGQYLKGYVQNHSVGMMYVSLKLAVNDPQYKEEFAVYETYYEDIANKQDVDESGIFYAVLEAKIIEGSAVPRGSNSMTPTQSIESVKNTSIASAKATQSFFNHLI